MKKFNLTESLVLILLIVSTTFAQSLQDGLASQSINSNNIQAVFTNKGGLYSGVPIYWVNPVRTEINKNIVYDLGIQLTGKINGEIVSAFNQWVSTFSPGPILDGQSAMISHPENQSRYRVYKISKGDDSSVPDYAEWPVDFGAPLDKYGRPLMRGDENLWCVYNCYHPSVPTQYGYLKNLKSIPIEIQQYTYAVQSPNSNSILNDVLFLEYKIINKGNASIDSMNIGFWTDVDFYDGNSIDNNNLPAVDIERELGYCWSEVDTSESMVSVGVTQLFGPVKDATNSKAVFNGKLIDNKSNLKLSAFHAIADDSYNHPFLGIITDNLHAWNYSNGYDKDGNDIINPNTNIPTKFPFDGDPVSNSGWIYDNDSNRTGGGAGFSMFSGSVTLAPNDTQWVMYALVPAIGKTGKDAIGDLRYRVDTLRSLSYEKLVVTSIRDKERLQSVPQKFYLAQNYPNPFNPVTTISFNIPESNLITLKIYDVLGNEVATLINNRLAAGTHRINFDAKNLSSGIYFFKLSSGNYSQSRKMILMK